MTDWTYELQERDEQKRWFQEHREDRVTFDSIEGRNKRLENIEKMVKLLITNTFCVK